MALSFGNRQRNLTANAWSTQRQQLLVRRQHSFVETGNHANALSISNRGRGVLTRELSVGRSYDGVRQKLNNSGTALRNAGSYVCLQRQNTLDQDFKLKPNTKPRETPSRNSQNSFLSNSSKRSNFSRRNTCVGNNNCENIKIKERSIVAWSSTTSLLKSQEDEEGINAKKNNCYAIIGDKKSKEARKVSTTSNSLQQRLHSSSRSEANKINLSIVLPQAAKTSLDSEAVVSDIESSLDCAINSDTPCATLPKSSTNVISQGINTPQVSLSPSTVTTSTQSNSTNYSNTAVYRRAQFRSSHLNTITTSTTATSSNATTLSNSTTPSSQTSVSTVIATPITNSATLFSASPSLIVRKRPPLVRAMSAPVRPLDDNSKGALAASKRKPRRRRIIARNISCDKTSDQDFITTEIINGKKILTRSRSVVSSEVITLVSLMSSEGSDSEKEDTQTAPSTANLSKSESSPNRRAPSLRKTGKSVSFQENYPPNFQLASKEYSHMIRRGSIAPLTARLRTNRPPTAPPGSIFLNVTSNTEPISVKDRESNTENSEKRTPMSEKAGNTTSTDETIEYVFPDYVRSIKERECWKLYQKMCNKGVNVAYDTILRGMLTPTEFRQIQKQRELEEAKAREAEAANEDENTKPPSQSAIDRLSEALLKK